jgi:hypothetical protein
MEKKANMKKRVFYKSTSVLGQIYDMADILTDNLGYSHQGMSTPPCKSLTGQGLFVYQLCSGQTNWALPKS